MYMRGEEAEMPEASQFVKISIENIPTPPNVAFWYLETLESVVAYAAACSYMHTRIVCICNHKCCLRLCTFVYICKHTYEY